MWRDGGRTTGERVEERRLSGVRQPDETQTLHGRHRTGSTVAPMSKKTAKRKIRSRRKKANHGKRPNTGRR